MHKKILNSGLIISSNLRSLIYLKVLKKENFLPKTIIFLKKNNEKLYNIKILSFLRENKKKIYLKIFNTSFINNKNVLNYIKKLNNKIFIVSLYPGKEGIIRDKLLLKKKFFLHSHSGKLPKYKGSTTIFYSILIERKIWCDTFFLTKEIDQGEVIFSKRYSLPKNINSIDADYDARIRALNLVCALKKIYSKKFKKKKIKISQNENFSYYYIMHPILRLLTLKKIKNV